MTNAATVFKRGGFEFVWNEDEHAGYFYVVPSIGDGQAAIQRQLADNVIADFDTDGHLLGIEFLGASE